MFLPIGDDQDHERTPWVTRALIAANAAVFLLICMPQPSMALLLRHGLNPAALRPEQFFTHLFLHLDLFHLLGNLLFLWIFGRLVEERLGSPGMALLYLGSGLGSAGLHLWLERPPGVAAGASGAVSGMIGACLIFCPRARIKVVYWFFLIGTALVPVAVWALVWAGLQILGSMGRSSTAYWGHLGCFAAGAAAAWAIRELAARRGRRREPPLESRDPRRAFAAVSDDEDVFLDASVDAFALVYLEEIPEGAARTGVVARGLPRTAADALRKELRAPAALIADQEANHPPAPKAVDAASWDGRVLRLRVGTEVATLPWGAPALVVDARVGESRFIDVLLTRTAAFRIPEKPGVGLTRVDPERRQEEASTLGGLAKAFEERRAVAGGDFEDEASYADYVFRAWHLARAGRPVAKC